MGQKTEHGQIKSLVTTAAVLSVCQDVTNYKWRLNPVWHRMLYSCTHMATVCVKGLNSEELRMKNYVNDPLHTFLWHTACIVGISLKELHVNG